MILADVSVREDVITELLRIAEARAVAEHQPGMGPKHRDMIGDIASVRRAGADVDHGNARGALLNEMKCRHLRRAWGWRSGRSRVTEAGIARDDVSRLDECLVSRVTRRHTLAADARKGLHVELIVREDHEVLEMLRVGPRIVVEP